MLLDYIGITLSSAAFLATVFYIMRDLKRVERERRHQRIIQRVTER